MSASCTRVITAEPHNLLSASFFFPSSPSLPLFSFPSPKVSRRNHYNDQCLNWALRRGFPLLGVFTISSPVADANRFTLDVDPSTYCLKMEEVCTSTLTGAPFTNYGYKMANCYHSELEPGVIKEGSSNYPGQPYGGGKRCRWDDGES